MVKVLFFPAAVGLAHIGRCIEVAKVLREKNIDVLFGVGSDGPDIVARENLPFEKIPEFPRAIYDEKIKHNNWSIYSIGLINKFVKSEIKLIKSYQPDLIVSDLRVTAKISSLLTARPLVSITNVDATKYYDYSKVKLPFKTYFGKFLPPVFLNYLDTSGGQKMLRKVGPGIIIAIFLKELFKFNLVLARYGKKPILSPFDLSMGDLTLLSDIPEYRPVKKLPKNVKLVGPIFWDGIRKLPKWHRQVSDKKNIIYVTASGTGDREVFLKILKFLQGTSYTIVATCGNTLSVDDVGIRYPSLFLTDFLPGEWIMQRAKMIIFPGGNATSYQALFYGVPQIGTPLHLDQEDNMNQLARLGTGIALNPRSNFTRGILLEKIDIIVKNKSFLRNALRMKKEMQKMHGAQNAADEIINFLKSRKVVY